MKKAGKQQGDNGSSTSAVSETSADSPSSCVNSESFGSTAKVGRKRKCRKGEKQDLLDEDRSGGKKRKQKKSSSGSREPHPSFEGTRNTDGSVWSKLGAFRCRRCGFTTTEEAVYNFHCCSVKKSSSVLVKSTPSPTTSCSSASYVSKPGSANVCNVSKESKITTTTTALSDSISTARVHITSSTRSGSVSDNSITPTILLGGYVVPSASQPAAVDCCVTVTTTSAITVPSSCSELAVQKIPSQASLLPKSASSVVRNSSAYTVSSSASATSVSVSSASQLAKTPTREQRQGYLRYDRNAQKYICLQCKYSVSESNSIIEHLMYQLTANPYNCTICKVGFSTRAKIQEHFHQKHKGRKIECLLKHVKRVKQIMSQAREDAKKDKETAFPLHSAFTECIRLSGIKSRSVSCTLSCLSNTSVNCEIPVASDSSVSSSKCTNNEASEVESSRICTDDSKSCIAAPDKTCVMKGACNVFNCAIDPAESEDEVFDTSHIQDNVSTTFGHGKNNTSSVSSQPIDSENSHEGGVYTAASIICEAAETRFGAAPVTGEIDSELNMTSQRTDFSPVTTSFASSVPVVTSQTQSISGIEKIRSSTMYTSIHSQQTVQFHNRPVQECSMFEHQQNKVMNLHRHESSEQEQNIQITLQHTCLQAAAQASSCFPLPLTGQRQRSPIQSSSVFRPDFLAQGFAQSSYGQLAQQFQQHLPVTNQQLTPCVQNILPTLLWQQAVTPGQQQQATDMQGAFQSMSRTLLHDFQTTQIGHAHIHQNSISYRQSAQRNVVRNSPDGGTSEINDSSTVHFKSCAPPPLMQVHAVHQADTVRDLVRTESSQIQTSVEASATTNALCVYSPISPAMTPIYSPISSPASSAPTDVAMVYSPISPPVSSVHPVTTVTSSCLERSVEPHTLVSNAESRDEIVAASSSGAFTVSEHQVFCTAGSVMVQPGATIGSITADTVSSALTTTMRKEDEHIGSSSVSLNGMFVKYHNSYACLRCSTRISNKDDFYGHVWNHMHPQGELCSSCSDPVNKSCTRSKNLVESVSSKLNRHVLWQLNEECRKKISRKFLGKESSESPGVESCEGHSPVSVTIEGMHADLSSSKDTMEIHGENADRESGRATEIKPEDPLVQSAENDNTQGTETNATREHHQLENDDTEQQQMESCAIRERNQIDENNTQREDSQSEQDEEEQSCINSEHSSQHSELEVCCSVSRFEPAWVETAPENDESGNKRNQEVMETADGSGDQADVPEEGETMDSGKDLAPDNEIQELTPEPEPQQADVDSASDSGEAQQDHIQSRDYNQCIDNRLSRDSSQDGESEDAFFICTLCNFSCDTAVDFTIHLHSDHHNEPCFPCYLCNYQGQYTTDLTNHLATHTTGDSDIYLCPFAADSCQFETHNLQGLSSHMEQHKEYFSCRCNRCSSNFKDATEFLNHIKFHTKTLYTCSKCAARFLEKSAIVKHWQAEHSGGIHYKVLKMLLCLDRKQNAYQPPTHRASLDKVPLEPTVENSCDEESTASKASSPQVSESQADIGIPENSESVSNFPGSIPQDSAVTAVMNTHIVSEISVPLTSSTTAPVSNINVLASDLVAPVSSIVVSASATVGSDSVVSVSNSVVSVFSSDAEVAESSTGIPVPVSTAIMPKTMVSVLDSAPSVLETEVPLSEIVSLVSDTGSSGLKKSLTSENQICYGKCASESDLAEEGELCCENLKVSQDSNGQSVSETCNRVVSSPHLDQCPLKSELVEDTVAIGLKIVDVGTLSGDDSTSSSLPDVFCSNAFETEVSLSSQHDENICINDSRDHQPELVARLCVSEQNVMERMDTDRLLKPPVDVGSVTTSELPHRESVYAAIPSSTQSESGVHENIPMDTVDHVPDALPLPDTTVEDREIMVRLTDLFGSKELHDVFFGYLYHKCGSLLRCSTCEKVFDKLHCIHEDLFFHLNVSLFECCFCDFDCFFKQDMKKHLKRTHPGGKLMSRSFLVDRNKLLADLEKEKPLTIQKLKVICKDFAKQNSNSSIDGADSSVPVVSPELCTSQNPEITDTVGKSCIGDTGDACGPSSVQVVGQLHASASSLLLRKSTASAFALERKVDVQKGNVLSAEEYDCGQMLNESVSSEESRRELSPDNSQDLDSIKSTNDSETEDAGCVPDPIADGNHKEESSEEDEVIMPPKNKKKRINPILDSDPDEDEIKRKNSMDTDLQNKKLNNQEPEVGSEQTVECKYCSFTALSSYTDELKEHIKDKHPHLLHLIKCGYCDSPYGNVGVLRKHTRNCHPGRTEKIDRVPISEYFKEKENCCPKSQSESVDMERRKSKMKPGARVTQEICPKTKNSLHDMKHTSTPGQKFAASSKSVVAEKTEREISAACDRSQKMEKSVVYDNPKKTDVTNASDNIGEAEVSDASSIPKTTERCGGSCKAKTVASYTLDKSEKLEACSAYDTSEKTEASRTSNKQEKAEISSATDKSEKSEASCASNKSEKTETSGASEKPKKTETSGASEKPKKTETSGASEKPKKTETSGASDKPNKTEVSGTSGKGVSSVATQDVGKHPRKRSGFYESCSADPTAPKKVKMTVASECSVVDDKTDRKSSTKKGQKHIKSSEAKILSILLSKESAKKDTVLKHPNVTGSDIRDGNKVWSDCTAVTSAPLACSSRTTTSIEQTGSVGPLHTGRQVSAVTATASGLGSSSSTLDISTKEPAHAMDKESKLNHNCRYRCVLCDQKLVDRSSMRAHLIRHPECNTVPCDICSEQLSTREAVQQHYLSRHPGKLFTEKIPRDRESFISGLIKDSLVPRKRQTLQKEKKTQPAASPAPPPPEVEYKQSIQCLQCKVAHDSIYKFKMHCQSEHKDDNKKLWKDMLSQGIQDLDGKTVYHESGSSSVVHKYLCAYCAWRFINSELASVHKQEKHPEKKHLWVVCLGADQYKSGHHGDYTSAPPTQSSDPAYQMPCPATSSGTTSSKTDGTLAATARTDRDVSKTSEMVQESHSVKRWLAINPKLDKARVVLKNIASAEGMYEIKNLMDSCGVGSIHFGDAIPAEMYQKLLRFQPFAGYHA